MVLTCIIASVFGATLAEEPKIVLEANYLKPGRQQISIGGQLDSGADYSLTVLNSKGRDIRPVDSNGGKFFYQIDEEGKYSVGLFKNKALIKEEYLVVYQPPDSISFAEDGKKSDHLEVRGNEVVLQAYSFSDEKRKVFGGVEWDPGTLSISANNPGKGGASVKKITYDLNTPILVKKPEGSQEGTLTIRDAVKKQISATLKISFKESFPQDSSVTITPTSARLGVKTEFELKGLEREVVEVKIGEEVMSLNNGKFTYKPTTKDSVKVKIKAGGSEQSTIVYSKEISVSEGVSHLTIVPLDTAPGVPFLAGQMRRYQVQAWDRTSHITEAKVKLTNVSVEPAESGQIEFSPGSDEFMFRATSSRADRLVVTAQVEINGSNAEHGTGTETLFTSKLNVSVLTVLGFRNVSVQLVPMDDTMVEQLYGSQTRRQFSAYQVRINNNLLDQMGQPAQKSIIAYSASLGTGVILEKLSTDPVQRKADWELAKTKEFTGVPSVWDPRKPYWPTVSIADYDRQFGYVKTLGHTEGRVELEEGKLGVTPLSTTLLVGQIVAFELRAPRSYTDARIENAKVQKFTSETFCDVGQSEFQTSLEDNVVKGMAAKQGSYTLTFTVTYNGEEVETKGGGGRKTSTFISRVEVIDPEKANKIFTYNPYRFSIMESTASIRAEGDDRNKVIPILESIGSIGTFIFNVFNAKGQAPGAISNWSNLVIPGYKRAVPGVSDLQRANLIRDIMQPMEEVAYGQDIERTVFFPRGQFSNVIKGYHTRIASIDVSRYQIQIAIVESKALMNDSNQSGATGPKGTIGGGTK